MEPTHLSPSAHERLTEELNWRSGPRRMEISEWIEAFDYVVAEDWEHGAELFGALRQRAREAGVPTPGELTTPYRNTIPKHDEVPYPGDRNLERRVEALIRWNAMAMVHGQNKKDAGIGGHISTYSSLATLLEVGFNHFFHAKYGEEPGDFEDRGDRHRG